MNWNTWGRWGVAMLVVGCGSKLQVDKIPPGQGGGTGAISIAGGTGGQIIEPGSPGSLGQPCVKGGTSTDAKGTFAQTDIVVPDHCADGLTCGSDGLCAAIPDCPQASGVCFVRRGDPVASGGGGAGGTAGLGIGGSFNLGAARPEPTVVALAADASHLYWAEYGTRDSLGNYQNDGAVVSFASADGTTNNVASALPGPVGLGVTSTQAYVYVDGAPLIGSPIHSQLLRLPLAGGEPELVQDGTPPRLFRGVGDQAFWDTMTLVDLGDSQVTSTETLYMQPSSAGAAPSVFFDDLASEVVAADATNLYLYDATGMLSAPLAGGAPRSVGLPLLPVFDTKDDSLYAIEEINGGGLILNRAAKSGGAWQRVRALGAGGLGAFQIIGDRFFWSAYVPQGSTLLEIVQTASFSSDAPPVRLLERVEQPYPDPFLWIGNTTALYWTDGSAIYSRSLADLP